jgi:hypothetical protein
MVAALDPAHPVNGTIMRRVSVARLLEEHDHPDSKPWFDVQTSHGEISRSQHDNPSRLPSGRLEGSAEEDRGAGDANDQPQDTTPGPESGGQSQESKGQTMRFFNLLPRELAPGDQWDDGQIVESIEPWESSSQCLIMFQDGTSIVWPWEAPRRIYRP